MFTVYNNGSVKFRSTSDNLYRMDRLDSSAEVRLKPDDDMFHFLENTTDQKKQTYTQEAISTYKKMTKMNTNERVYHVQDIMTHNCISINLDDSVLDAYELLKEKQIAQIPIVTDLNEIVSIINKKMILNLMMEDLQYAQDLLNKKLKDILLQEVITVDPISDIRRVAKVMLTQRIDAIPVVNQSDLLVGIVSKTDIIKAVSNIPDLRLWA